LRGRPFGRARHQRIVWIAVCLLLAVIGGRWAWDHAAGKTPPASPARPPLPPEGKGHPRPAPDLVASAQPIPSAQPSRLPRTIVVLGSESVSHALDRLDLKIRTGDAQAAFDAYEMADFCAIPSEVYRSTLRGLPIGVFAEVRPTLELDAEDQDGICSGTTPAQLGRRFAYLQIAADHAVPGAAERLLETEHAANNDRNDPTAKEWEQNTVELVRRDAVGGDLDALKLMASLYRSGDVVARNTAQALVYQLAAEELMAAQPRQLTPGELELEREFTDGYKNAVPIEERDAAKLAALDLLARCCSRLAR
jgi:hypothetical protein